MGRLHILTALRYGDRLRCEPERLLFSGLQLHGIASVRGAHVLPCRRGRVAAQDKMLTRVQTAREEAKCAADFDYGAGLMACELHAFHCD